MPADDTEGQPTEPPPPTEPVEAQPPAPAPPASWTLDDLEEVERNERSRRLPVLLGVLVVALVAVAAFIVVAKPFDAQKDKVWPLDVGGRPEGLGDRGEMAEEVAPEVPAGAYLWNDFDGWHLWFSLDPTFSKVSGTIVSDDEIGSSRLTPAAAGTVTESGKAIDFDIDASSNIAGIDFEPGFYSERIEVTILGPDGKPLPAEMIHRGASMAPAEVPVVVEKVTED